MKKRRTKAEIERDAYYDGIVADYLKKLKPINNPKKGEKPIYRQAGCMPDFITPFTTTEEFLEPVKW
ncbi:MAG: hypothetical protein LBQ31_03505 [Bacteroidales bacterium]|jgi:hypothetical protein|nr:hypothetical protein [Bacteroidales bacterium]